jgi:hypothetical protein
MERLQKGRPKPGRAGVRFRLATQGKAGIDEGEAMERCAQGVRRLEGIALYTCCGYCCAVPHLLCAVPSPNAGALCSSSSLLCMLRSA